MVGKKDKYLVAAQKFIERGQLDKALVEFAKVVQEDPKDTRTWLKMAELHAKRGGNAEATEIYLRTGDLYSEQGSAQKAVAVYKNVLKLSPGTVAAHLKLGGLFKQIGLVSDAVQQFELAAAALQRANKSSEAVAAVRQAVETQPDNVVLRVKLAESASQAGLVDEAIREFGKAADDLKAQGRTDESLRVVERILFHQPDNFANARELAEAYIAKGSPRLALPKLQACLKGDSRDPRTLSLLAKALEQLGQVPKAVSVLKELVRLCQELGRSSERDAAILRGLTLDPSDHELRAVAARHHLRGAAGAAGEATPPPVGLNDSSDSRRGGGTFHLSGVEPIPAGGGSGRVIKSVGAAEGSARGAAVGAAFGSGGIAGPAVGRILAEADVFVKYGLLERAADHLGRVFEFDPAHRDAREKLIGVLQRLGRRDDAARQIEILAQQLAPTSPAEAKKLAEKALLLDPRAEKARALFETLPGPGLDSLPGIALDAEDDPAANVETPPVGTDPSIEAIAATPLPIAAASIADAEDDAGGFDVEISTVDLAAAVDIEFPSGDVVSSINAEFDAAFGSVGDRVDTGDDEETDAFSEAEATIAGEGDLFAVAPQMVDEDELSAELDQVTFFIEQSLAEEARSLLQDLEARFFRHSRVVAKFQELRVFEARSGALDVATPPVGSDDHLPAVGSTVIEGPGSNVEGTPPPRAVVTGGDGADFSTHADLGIAYKEMGLFDAAIAELKLLAREPEREVFALTIMGECYESKGSFTDAVLRYKRALNCPQVTKEETRALYFLLGGAFEHLGDVSEALYFYEKVAKRDPKFRDVGQKVAELKPRLVKRAR